jgi:uncharacterized membrane protein YhaH (DUF805 family)
MDFMKGRTNRATYWLSIGVLVALLAAIARFAENPPRISEVALVILCVPRLHDIGRTGWWAAILIPVEIASVAAVLFAPEALGLQLAGAFTLLLLLPVIGLGLVRGEPAANRFGEPPPPGLNWRRKAKDI